MRAGSVSDGPCICEPEASATAPAAGGQTDAYGPSLTLPAREEITMRMIAWSAGLSVLFLAGPSGLGQNKSAEGEVKVCKYDQLMDVVRKNQGKVVLVDIWHTT